MKKFILIRVLSGVVLLVAVLVTMSLFSIPHFVNPLAELKVEDVEAVEVWYYDRTALLEGDHTLSAYVGGHLFEVGQRGFHSFLSVDGEELIRKTRWI